MPTFNLKPDQKLICGKGHIFTNDKLKTYTVYFPSRFCQEEDGGKIKCPVCGEEEDITPFGLEHHGLWSSNPNIIDNNLIHNFNKKIGHTLWNIHE